jgi:hypothetical protein
MYLCPNDGGLLVTIQDQAYSFHEGELTITVGGDEFDWWDFVNGDAPRRR